MGSSYIEEPGQLAESIDWWDLHYASVNDQLICPICRTIFVDPYSTECGHVFCFECLSTMKKSANSSTFVCPVDRKELHVAPQPAPFLIKSLLDELIVSCPYSCRGCTFVGKRWLLNSHVSFECQFALVYCFPPCTGLVERRHFDKESGACQCEKLQNSERSESAGSENVADQIENSESDDQLEFSIDVAEEPGTADNDMSSGSEKIGHCAYCRDQHMTESAIAGDSVNILEVLERQNKRMDALEAENRTLKRQLDVCQRVTMRSTTELDTQMLMEYDRVVQELKNTSSMLAVQQQSVANLITLNSRTNTEMQYLKGIVDSIRRQLFLLNQSQRRLSMHSQSQLSSSLSSIEADDCIAEDLARRRAQQKL